MLDEELQIVSNLTGVNQKDIRFNNNGFLSRGYIIDDGRIVFKFKKYPEISYQNEIKMLNFINSLGLNLNIQKVGWVSPDDSYLGVYGIPGELLKTITLTDKKRQAYGKQIGLFLKKLHSINSPTAKKFDLNEEIAAWQKKFERSKHILSHYFSNEDIKKMDHFVNHVAPKELASLGEKMVFSHGDLGMGNILVDDTGKIGFIDFSESTYLDEAADFMDMEDDKLCLEVLNSYGANDVLRKKVSIRRIIHPMFVIGTYQDRSKEELSYFVNKIKNWLG